MTIPEENCAEQINSLQLQDWEPLFSLIPVIENTQEFGKLLSGGMDVEEATVVRKFRNVVYAIPIVISFNWPAWDEGRAMTSNEAFDFNTVDVVTKCKLISAILRNDRFCEGALVSAFESGLIYKLLQSIKTQVTENLAV